MQDTIDEIVDGFLAGGAAKTRATELYQDNFDLDEIQEYPFWKDMRGCAWVQHGAKSMRIKSFMFEHICPYPPVHICNLKLIYYPKFAQRPLKHFTR